MKKESKKVAGGEGKKSKTEGGKSQRSANRIKSDRRVAEIAEKILRSGMAETNAQYETGRLVDEYVKKENPEGKKAANGQDPYRRLAEAIQKRGGRAYDPKRLREYRSVYLLVKRLGGPATVAGVCYSILLAASGLSDDAAKTLIDVTLTGGLSVREAEEKALFKDPVRLDRFLNAQMSRMDRIVLSINDIIVAKQQPTEETLTRLRSVLDNVQKLLAKVAGKELK